MTEINNLTTNEIDENFIKKIVEVIFKGEKVKKKQEISIAFIGASRMQKLNRKYRGKNKVTDVLSFSEPEVFLNSDNLGEVIICLKEVKKSARKFDVSFEQELSRILIHGILHILGYDHEKSKSETIEMEKRENYYLEKIFSHKHT